MKKASAPPEDWDGYVKAGRAAVARRDKSNFELGDLAIAVSADARYGDAKLPHYANEIGVPYKTLLDYRRVAQAFQNSERSELVSWSGHEILAAQPDPVECLTAAIESGQTTVAEISQNYRPPKDSTAKREPPPEKYVTCPGCNLTFSLTPDTSELDDEIENLSAAIDERPELDKFEPWLDRTELRYSRAVIAAWRRGEPNSGLHPTPNGEVTYLDILDVAAQELGFDARDKDGPSGAVDMMLAAVTDRLKNKDRRTAAIHERAALRANGVISSAPPDEQADGLARLEAAGRADKEPPPEPGKQIAAAERKAQLRGFVRRSHRKTAVEVEAAPGEAAS